MSATAPPLAIAISLRSTTWLVLALALVAAPHAMRLPVWLTALAAALCLWRLYLARMRLALPARWLMIFLAMAGAAAIYLDYRTLFGRDSGVALLVLMISLKLMETRVQRDGMVLACIGYFLVITNFFYTQSIPTALYLLVCVWLITAAMIGLQYASEPTAYRGQMRIAAIMLLQSAPLMIVFFMLFPRMQGPLWGMPADAFAGITGLSDSMSPGSLNMLVFSDEVAMRVAFDGPLPPPNRLYWRGPVLMDFDGRTWTTPPRPLRSIIELERRADAVRYTVMLEPHNRHWLFALDLPGVLPPEVVVTADHLLLSRAPVTRRRRYEMTSFLDAGFGANASPAVLSRMLQLPQRFNPQTRELGQKMRAQYGASGGNAALVNAALAMLRDQKFLYTLEPPLLGVHAVDEFLFNTRSGFCEHFASAFVVLMRAAGVPSRVVTGYLGGEYNALGNYLLVRQSDAHAWSEVWLENQGWVRVDPTYAVSPARADSGLAAALPLRDAYLFGARSDNKWLYQLAMTWDSLANTWNQTLLGYNFESQRALLYRAGLDEATWRTLAMLLIAATIVVTLLLALFTLRNRAHRHDPALAAYRVFCAKTARAGVARRDAEGPLDYAARLVLARPEVAAAVQAITRLYVAVRYENKLQNNTLRELQQQVRQFSA